MKKISCFFLFMLALSVYAEKKKLPVISKGKQIIWKKDGAKMAIVRPYMGTSAAGFVAWLISNENKGIDDEKD